MSSIRAGEVNQEVLGKWIALFGQVQTQNLIGGFGPCCDRWLHYDPIFIAVRTSQITRGIRRNRDPTCQDLIAVHSSSRFQVAIAYVHDTSWGDRLWRREDGEDPLDVKRRWQSREWMPVPSRMNLNLGVHGRKEWFKTPLM